MRILLVEDNRDILANLADYLGMKGYTVDCAQDGLSGLHLAATEHYDLIVLDIMLPASTATRCASACARMPAAIPR
jgi:DNA-binding response OmpR family regulator